MSALTLDTSDIPAWDLTLEIRGTRVPTLGPLEAADRSVVNLGERRPGALVRAWRWAFGEPRRRVADDHETRELRHTVAAFVPAAHRRVLEDLGGGELLAVLAHYVGAQQAWYAAIERQARAAAEAATPASAPNIPPSPVGVTHEQRLAAGRRVASPPTKLRPGEPLPAMAAGLVDDFRKGGDA